jgi:hypothetical protein
MSIRQKVREGMRPRPRCAEENNAGKEAMIAELTGRLSWSCKYATKLLGSKAGWEGSIPDGTMLWMYPSFGVRPGTGYLAVKSSVPHPRVSTDPIYRLPGVHGAGNLDLRHHASG